MGAPLEDAPRLHHWSNWIQRQFDAGSMATERERIEQAVEEFYEYAEALVRARRENPGDDLISMLIAAEEEGDRKLSDVECINLVFNVLVGGVDTSQSQLAHAITAARRTPRAVGAARGRTRRWPSAPSRRRCATSRSRRSRRGSSTEEVVLPRRDLPGGTRS